MIIFDKFISRLMNITKVIICVKPKLFDHQLKQRYLAKIIFHVSLHLLLLFSIRSSLFSCFPCLSIPTKFCCRNITASRDVLKFQMLPQNMFRAWIGILALLKQNSFLLPSLWLRNTKKLAIPITVGNKCRRYCLTSLNNLDLKQHSKMELTI